MSTRAVYTFKDNRGSHSVYKHYDGYPEGALSFIKEAKKYAWELPRFDASEFAAAFIAANKNEAGGDLYLTYGHEEHGDLDYRYEISADKDKLLVKVFKVEEYDEDARKPIYSPIEQITL
jgi:hypothetical protein